MKPLEFSVSMVEEDPNGFIDYKTLAITGLTSRKKEELEAYELKCIAQFV